MATSDILGLFTTPEQYQLAQRKAQEDEASQFARLDPRAKASFGFYRAGQQFGDAIGGALGGVDPQLQKITQRQQLLGMIDPANPDSFAKAIQAALQTGDQEAAFLLRNEMMKVQQQAFTTRKATAEAEKAELSVTQEKNFRDELSKLVNPTEEDIVRIATKYGSSDKVLSIVQTSITRAKDRQERLDIANEREQGRLDIAKDRIQAQRDRDLDKATTQKERDEAQRKFEERMQQADRDSKQAIAKIAASLKQAPAPSITPIVDPTNPNQMISIDTRKYQGGGIGSAGVIGISGKEPSAALRENKATEGKSQLQDQLDDLRESFTSLNEQKAITSAERNPVSNLLSSVQSSTVGQIAGKTFGTKEQTQRNLINSAKQRISQAIKNATGMSSQQLNSNFELKSMLESLSDVSLGYEASMEIIDRLERDYVKGSGMKKGAPPSGNTSSGQTSKGTKYQVLPN